jgi:CRP-like cAMP-binding protein
MGRHRLSAIKLLHGLDDGQLAAVEAAGEWLRFEAGDVVFAEGDGGGELYFVAEGRAEITVALGGTAEQAPVHMAAPGSVFGELALCHDGPRTATVRVVKDAEILRVGREALQALFDRDPHAGYLVMGNLCRILSERMCKTTRELRASLMW